MNSRIRQYVGKPATLVASLFLLAVAAVADDSDFFSNSVAPNVVLIMDTSGSMRTVVEHPYFDPVDWPYTEADGSGTCDIIPDSKTDDNDFNDENGDTVDADCGTYCRILVISSAPGFVTTSDTGDDANHGSFADGRQIGLHRKRRFRPCAERALVQDDDSPDDDHRQDQLQPTAALLACHLVSSRKREGNGTPVFYHSTGPPNASAASSRSSCSRPLYRGEM